MSAMSKKFSRTLFYIFAIIFFISLALIAYDFARKTVFPNSKEPEQEYNQTESERVDSVKVETEK